MKVSFYSEELVKLYLTPLHQLKGKQKFSQEIIRQFKKKVIILKTLNNVKEIKDYKGLRFERLKGNLSEFYSIRLNKQYRLLFKILEEAGRTYY